MKDLINQLDIGVCEFGEPWRVTNKSSTIIVPIIARTKRKRKYVVLEEVKDKVKIVDTGKINKARIEGNLNRSIFIRGGTILKGTTQARATQFGIIATPRKPANIPVHCIHASKRILPGAIFQSGSQTPRCIYSTMLSERNQNSTWSEVSAYSTRMTSETNQLYSPKDDLVKTIETIHRLKEDLKEVLEQIPNHLNQVGTTIIDCDGVLGLEIYDNPDSWKALSRSIMPTYAEALASENVTRTFKPDKTVIILLIHNFLKSLDKATEETVFSRDMAATIIRRTEEYVGEYTTYRGKTIHLQVTRRTPTKKRARLT